MQYKLFLIIIGIVFCIALGTHSKAAFSAEQIKSLVTKYKKLTAQKEAAENESGLQSIEKIIRLEKEIEQLVTRIQSVLPDWQENAETNVGFNDVFSTFEARVGQKGKPTMPKKLSEQDHKDFLTKEMTELRTKMLDQQDQISKTKNDKQRAKLQQDLRRMGQELNVLRESLGDTAVGKKAVSITHTPQLFMDRKNADRDHEHFLQDQLQAVYEKIYILREKSLEEQSGEALKDIGNEITKLENEELTLTRRLLAIGAKPLPPKVLAKNRPTPKSPDFKTESVQYREDLMKRIKEIREEIQFLQSMKKKVTSGSAMAELGLQISRRESEINLLKVTLAQISPKSIASDKKKKHSNPHASSQAKVQAAVELEEKSIQMDQPMEQNKSISSLLEGPAMNPTPKHLWEVEYIPQGTNITPGQIPLNRQELQHAQASNVIAVINNSRESSQYIPPNPYTRNNPQNPQNSVIFKPVSNWGRGIA